MSTRTQQAPKERSQGIPLPANVRAYALVQTLLGIVFLAWSAIYWHRGYRDAMHAWPFAGFVYFGDFTIYVHRFAFLHTPQFFSADPSLNFPFAYPAPVALLYEAFYSLPRHRYGFFLLITLFVMAIMMALAVRAIVRRGVAPFKAAALVIGCTVFSYPFWSEYLTGNMEICIFFLVAGGLAAFLCGHDGLAVVLFALATSMKLFPAVYFGLFLARKQYRQIALGAALTLLSTLISLWVVCPSLSTAWRGINAGLAGVQQLLILSRQTAMAGFDHSLFRMYRETVSLLLRRPVSLTELHVYMLATACAGTLLFFLIIRRLPVLNQICCFVVVSVWLAPISYDYTLLHMFVPTFLLILFCLDSRGGGEHRKALMLAMLCCAVLLAPEEEIIVMGRASLAGFLKSAVLCVLFVTMLRHRFEMRRPEA